VSNRFSSQTIQENLGTPTNVAYSGANFGVVITKTNSSSANVDVSIGLNYAFSQMAKRGQNADREMLNKASVQVSRSADGATCGIYTIGCSSGVLSPTITGYLGYTSSGAIFIWIPKNSDGSPRGETRLLSQVNKPSGSARVVWNGDTPFGPISCSAIGATVIRLRNPLRPRTWPGWWALSPPPGAQSPFPPSPGVIREDRVHHALSIIWPDIAWPSFPEQGLYPLPII
jgi:hypothetical protein